MSSLKFRQRLEVFGDRNDIRVSGHSNPESLSIKQLRYQEDVSEGDIVTNAILTLSLGNNLLKA